MMLELLHNGLPTGLKIYPGDWFDVPGRRISPAVAGWESDDGYSLVEHVAPTPEPPTLADLRAEKLAALAEKRWEVETGGVQFQGSVVRTDATSQAKITGAVSLFQNDPSLQAIDFEVQPGEWITLDALAMKAIGIAAGRHVQACFSRARVLSDQILAAEDAAALAAIDLDEGWSG